MILMIDNYDSFTYNLVQYMGELGAEIRVDRNDKISIQEIEKLNPEKIVSDGWLKSVRWKWMSGLALSDTPTSCILFPMCGGF